MKESKIRRLIPKKLARRIAEADDEGRPALEAIAEGESGEVIAKMRGKGYKLLTRLEGGEGVFVREADVAALHVQLPKPLYRRLDAECKRREVSKRRLVTEALEAFLE